MSQEIDTHIADGLIHHRAGAFAKAESAYREALRRDSRNADALHLLGLVTYHRGDLDQAETLMRDALRESPASHEVLNSLASVLASMGRHAEAESALRNALDIAPDALKPRANLLFLLNLIPGVSRADLLAEHIEWGRRHASDLHEGNSGLNHSGSPELVTTERLRVGYVSADFCSHPVGRIISGVLRFHDRKMYEVFCYDNGSENDEVNTALRGLAEHWIEVAGIENQALAARIRSDRIHVLVDLSGHTRKHRLQVFALRPAPVQATWLGYLNTTGIKAIDWRITHPRADPPPLAQQWHTERLWYLPDCLWTWEAPTQAISLNPDPPCMKAGHVTFGSFNTFRKINDRVIETWAKILRRIPSARLRVYGAPGGKAVDRVYDLFELNEIESSRVDLFAPVEYSRYLRAYGDIDISLDPFPYNGGATTCESLWMGVPVVSLAGEGGFARSGASILGAMNLERFVAATEDEYVDIASGLAMNSEELSEMRRSLRKQFLASPLSAPLVFTQNLESAYKKMWIDWKRRKEQLLIDGR